MYKFRHVIKLDEYSGACVEILVNADDRLQVRAVDRVGDAWHIFMDCMERAELAERAQNLHDTNREIHSALSHLGSHLDGVVNGLCECLKRGSPDFTPPAYGRRKDCSLSEKVAYIASYSREKRGADIPALDLTFKAFRDVIVHPHIRKSVAVRSSSKRREIHQADVFDLTIDDLKAAGAMVDAWLGAVTAVYEYPRGYHTKRLAEEFSAKVIAAYRQRGGQLPSDAEIDTKIYRI